MEATRDTWTRPPLYSWNMVPAKGGEVRNTRVSCSSVPGIIQTAAIE